MSGVPGILISKIRIILLLLVLHTATALAQSSAPVQTTWAVSGSEWKATFADALGKTGKSSPIAKSLLYVYGMQLEKRSLEILQKHDKAIQHALDWGEKPPVFSRQDVSEVRSTAVRGNLLMWYALMLKDNPDSSDRSDWEAARRKNIQTRQKLMQRHGAETIRTSWRNLISTVGLLGLPRARLDGE